MAEIVVTGAGPAGVVAAIGLKRLGYQVTLVGRERRFSAVEGISARVVAALKQQQLLCSLDAVGNPAQREVQWGGLESAQNQEWLIDRVAFDNGLWRDAEAHGVCVRKASVERVDANDEEWWVCLADGQRLRADFWIEARGRSAPIIKADRPAVRGPESVSVLNRWSLAPGDSGSAVRSDATGWIWGARLAQGLGYWQYTVDVSERRLPSKVDLLQLCRHQQISCAVVKALFPEGVPSAVDLHVRAATSVLGNAISGRNWLRVGDAAMAVDSLSGNGIFQALSSALQAPAVVNTLLQEPQFGSLAQQFHQQRVEHLFYRFARMGREFYSQEISFENQPFWRLRQAWPDLAASHQTSIDGEVEIATRAVVENNFIRPREVVVTKDQPLGIWHLEGVELAPLVQRWQLGESWPNILSTYEAGLKAKLYYWLEQQGLTASVS